MSVIDKALEANREYAKTYDPKLGGRPNPKNRCCNLHGSPAQISLESSGCLTLISTLSEPADQR